MFKVALIMMNFVQKDGSGKDKSILVIHFSPGMWLLSKEPSYQQRFGRFQETIKFHQT